MQDGVPTGERRLYDEELWQLLKQKVEPNFIDLYKPFDLKIPFTQSLTNIAYHFNNARTVKKAVKKMADPNAISHIFFEEEAALLRLINLKKTVVTCLDIIPISFPQDISWHYRQFYKICIQGLKKADKILTVSNHTKKDLIKFLGIPESKISTAYWGINKIFKPTKIPEHFYKKYNLHPDKKYLLSVGGLHIARKNLATLIKIMPLILKECPDLELIIAGYNKEKSSTHLKDFIAKENLENKIHLLEKIPDQDLCYLYNTAEIFIFPSLYEGFGLPPVEAMACGTPVIASNNSSLPEAVGEAGILINPLSADEIIKAIKQIHTNKNLQNELREKGFKQRNKFSWSNYAENLHNTYIEMNHV